MQKEGPTLDPADLFLLQDGYYFLNEKIICLGYMYTWLQLLLPHWEGKQKNLAPFFTHWQNGLGRRIALPHPLKRKECDSPVCKRTAEITAEVSQAQQ